MVASSPQSRTLIFGGSGFLGLSLARHLVDRGRDVVIISRTPARDSGPWRWAAWDGRTVGDWARELDGADGVVNLAGRSVDCVKTPDRCDEILRSRVEATRAIGAALRDTGARPRVWVQMSTAHAYGDPPSAVCDEDSPFGVGLAPTVAREWERAFDDGAPDGVRRVILRTSFVLGRLGGALARLKSLARWGLGGTVGAGTQGISWLHELDMNRIFERALDRESMAGAYVASAPNPVSNREFMSELRRALRVPIGLPAPAFLVKLGAPLVMRTDPELALYGRYVVPKRLLAEGFDFRFSDVRSALADLLR